MERPAKPAAEEKCASGLHPAPPPKEGCGPCFTEAAGEVFREVFGPPPAPGV